MDSNSRLPASQRRGLPRRLTAAQQAILEEHLEDTFRNLDRDYNKRTDPNSPIPTVDVLLSERLTSLLNLILAIPPIPPTRYLQIALLLRFTASAREWIAGYPLQWPSGYTGNSSTGQGSTPGEQAQGTVTLLLEFLQQLDNGWRMVLRQTPGAEGQETGSAAPSQSLTATEKIRLRSSVISIRQTLLRWVERYTKLQAGSRYRTGPSSGRNRCPSPLGDPSSEKKPEPSDESDTGKSPGIVETAMDESGTSDGSLAAIEEKQGPGEWEIAISNSMSGTLELVMS